MLKSNARRGLLASLIVAGSLGLGAGIANADTPSHYQLTKKERKAACGNFQGSIIFSDGSSLDCSTGIATLPVETEN